MAYTTTLCIFCACRRSTAARTSASIIEEEAGVVDEDDDEIADADDKDEKNARLCRGGLKSAEAARGLAVLLLELQRREEDALLLGETW